MAGSDERVVDWQAPADDTPAPVDRRRLLGWVALGLLVILGGNALVGWFGNADLRRARGQASAVEELFTALGEGNRAAYIAGGLDRVARAGLSWGFLQHLSVAGEAATPRPGDTTVSASCTTTGPHVVRCELVQHGGPFAGLDTRARGYFLVDESGIVRRSWIELMADGQRLATFLMDLRRLLAEHRPEVHEAVFDTDLPLLHRQAFRDTLANRQLLTDAFTPPR